MLQIGSAELEAILNTILSERGLASLRSYFRALKGLVGELAGGKSQGIYEVLEHHTTLELQDPQGEVAVVERRQTVRFLQDNVEAISDHAWGDGELFAEYTCSPGVPVDFYKDGSRYTTLISLRQTMSRGTCSASASGARSSRASSSPTSVGRRTSIREPGTSP